MSHTFTRMKQQQKSKSSLPAVNICLSVEVHTEGWENPDQNIKEDL